MESVPALLGFSESDFAPYRAVRKSHRAFHLEALNVETESAAGRLARQR